MTTKRIRSNMIQGNANHNISTVDGDAVVVLSYASTPLNAITIGGKNMTKIFSNGDASAWYLGLSTTSSSVAVVVSAASSVEYSYYVLSNAGAIRHVVIDYTYNISGGARAQIPISSANLSPGNLCLANLVSVRMPKGTYFYRKSPFTTWEPLNGGYMNPSDGELVRHNFQKTTSGDSEEVHFTCDYGGFYTIVAVVEGHELSSFSVGSSPLL